MRHVILGLLLGLVLATTGGAWAWNHRPFDREWNEWQRQWDMDERFRDLRRDQKRQLDELREELKRDRPC